MSKPVTVSDLTKLAHLAGLVGVIRALQERAQDCPDNEKTPAGIRQLEAEQANSEALFAEAQKVVGVTVVVPTPPKHIVDSILIQAAAERRAQQAHLY